MEYEEECDDEQSIYAQNDQNETINDVPEENFEKLDNVHM